MSDSNNVGIKEGISLKPSQGYLEETVPPFTPFLAMEEASRCLLCYNPLCSEGCPANTNPGDFIRAIRFRNFKGAAEIIRSNNILGGVCARVCPYEKTCEEACARSGIDRPIQIGRLQRFVTDYEKTTNFQALDPPKATKEKIAMIGSGPASLSAAATLAMKGYQVTIFEEKEKPGGVLSYGIVPARLPQYVVDEEIEYVTNLGVEIKLNTRVGRDISLHEIRKQGYKAILIGAGMQISRTLDVPGKELEGVTTAVEYLAKARSKDANFNAGKHVVVIGGGDTAVVGGIFLLIAIIHSISSFIDYKTSEFGITNKRVLVKVGFIRRNSLEVLLTKVEGIQVKQGILGRILDYGSIVVSGTGGSKDPFSKIPAPLEFRKRAQEQVAAVQESR